MIILVFAVLALVFLIAEAFGRRRAREALGLELTFSAGEAFAGETVSFREVLVNRSRLPVPMLEVGFRVEKGLHFTDAENIAVSDYVYKRDVFSLLGRERITRRFRVECRRRGHYHITQTNIRTRVLPSHNQYVTRLPDGEQLYVYPRRVEVRDILASISTILGQYESARKVYEDPFAFASIREYTISDPMKTINWKASAKTGGLMVNTYTSVREEQLFVYLDVEDSGILKSADKVEECISVAATLCRKLLLKGLETSLAVGVPHGSRLGAVRFGPGRGQALLREIEQYLTRDFSVLDTVGMEELIRLAPPGNAIPVIITKNAGPELIRRVEKSLGQGRQALLVHVVGRGEDAALSYRSASVRVLRREVSL